VAALQGGIRNFLVVDLQISRGETHLESRYRGMCKRGRVCDASCLMKDQYETIETKPRQYEESVMRAHYFFLAPAFSAAEIKVSEVDRS
jgi:hypothetical protein